MNKYILNFIFLLFPAFTAVNAQTYNPTDGLEEAKRYFSDRILELDQIEGLYKIHLDVNIHNPYTGNEHVGYDEYAIIFDPYKAHGDNSIPFVLCYYSDGEINPYADIKKEKSTYSFKEKDVNGHLVTVKFQMITPSYFFFERKEKKGYSSCLRTTKATKIFPTEEMYKEAIINEETKEITINNPKILVNETKGGLVVNYVRITKQHTIINVTSNNGSPGEWLQLSKNSYIETTEKKYSLIKAEGIALTPQKTYFKSQNDKITFTMYFPPIPKSTSTIDFIENEDDSNWKLYGIILKQ